MNLSVIICTHNPRPDYLRRTLDSLKGQTLPGEQWELLLIDNASKDRLAASWDLSWHPHARHIREDELGLTAARLRGIREACGPWLVFVDDDNVLAADFLEKAIAIPPRYPHLGVFGAGILEPDFEVPPAAELTPLLSMLALRTVSQVLWSNNPDDHRCFPWGAGLCVSRRVAGYYCELVEKLNSSKVLDRRGQQLFCGGDDLFSWASAGAGQGFGLFPELRITHLIAAGRLNQRYFLRLVHDHAFSHAILRYLLFGREKPGRNFFVIARIFLHGLRYGHFSMRCEWASLRGKERAAGFIVEKGLRPVELGINRVSPGETNGRLAEALN